MVGKLLQSSMELLIIELGLSGQPLTEDYLTCSAWTTYSWLKSVWEKVGGFKEDKMLTVDNDIHRKIRISGEKVGLMKGIYVQHWYRGGIKENRQHLL